MVVTMAAEKLAPKAVQKVFSKLSSNKDFMSQLIEPI
jgi:hypothetical protein